MHGACHSSHSRGYFEKDDLKGSGRSHFTKAYKDLEEVILQKLTLAIQIRLQVSLQSTVNLVSL